MPYLTSKIHYNCSFAARIELQSAEKVIVALFSQTRESSHIFYQLYDLLSKVAKEKQQGRPSTLTTRDVLLLTLHMYSLMGETVEIEPEHENFLKKAFVDAMIAVQF